MTSDPVIIPLSKYDMDGEVIVADPGYRKRKIADAKSMGLAVKYVDGTQQIDMEKGYFSAYERASYYIESAPIAIKGYESLLDLLEMVDKKCPGGGDDLMNQILEEVNKIDKGNNSPFAKSPGAVTGRSE